MSLTVLGLCDMHVLTICDMYATNHVSIEKEGSILDTIELFLIPTCN